LILKIEKGVGKMLKNDQLLIDICSLVSKATDKLTVFSWILDERADEEFLQQLETGLNRYACFFKWLWIQEDVPGYAFPN